MRNLSYLILVISLVFTGLIMAQDNAGSSFFGLGFDAGLQYPKCDYDPAGLKPAAEIIGKLLLSDRFHLSLGIGYGEISDGFTKNYFVTNMVTADLKANINLVSFSKINPYAILGVGLYNFQFNKTNDRITKPFNREDIAGKRYFDGSIIIGGGLEISINPKLSLNAFVDYRHTTADVLDGHEAKANDGYINGRIGIISYLGKGRITTPKDDLLALESLDFGEAGTGDDEYDIFEDKLNRLDSSENENTMEEYIKLKSRVDELNKVISEKEIEIGNLKASLDFQDQRIADLEGQLSRTSVTRTSYSSAGGDDFSSIYDEALRGYYARDYSSAIQIFERLRDTYPNHKLASNCQYWIGESLFGLREYDEARQAFSKVFDFTSPQKKDDATLMIGRCYAAEGDTQTAKTYFQNVIDQYPDSEYVEKAREWLSRI